jgi:hypothetical protein
VSAYSAQFNGSNYSSFTDSTLLSFGTGDFTVEGWVYKTSAINGAIIDARTTLTAIPWGAYVDASNFPYFYTGSSLTSSIAITNNAWNHVVWTRISGVFKIYVNGVQGYSAALATNLDRSGTVTIGGTAAYTTGYISNLRVVKGLAVYTGAFTPPTSPLGTSQGAGTNIVAVSASQTSLLTCNGPGFTDSSSNALAITNNGAVVSSQFAPFSSFSAISRSASQTQTILTSGSGTYYTPYGIAWLRIRMVGGGGGGGASFAPNAGTAAGTGITTVFGAAQAFGGAGGWNTYFAGTGGAGGSGTLGGYTGIVIAGSQGAGAGAAAIAYGGGGKGGTSPFGGAGSGGLNTAASAAATNSGSGGGGGGGNASASTSPGTGGGAGGYVEAYISNPAASYAYTVGAGAAGGAAGVLAGGGGGSGIIIVEENYAVSTVSSNVYTVNYLIVAGGGGGGNYGGGGGAGGMTTGTNIIIPGQIYSITIGAGGAGASSGSGSGTHGSTGTNSSFNYNVAFGGGGGGGNDPSTVAAHTGYNGGSGGGASNQNAVGIAGLGVPGQGFNGGTGTGSAGTTISGGGGGASAVGGTPNGGAGLSSSITGSAITYAGGGGAGGSSATGSTGGTGGGGNYGVAGTANLGGGGGGYNGSGAFAGGSGVVILSVPTANYTGTTTGSPTITTNGIYKVLTFTASGSYTA